MNQEELLIRARDGDREAGEALIPASFGPSRGDFSGAASTRTTCISSAASAFSRPWPGST